MRPIRITLRDFGSFLGEHRIELGNVGLIAVTGPNGAGKTTLAVDAPRWALLGTTRGNADSVIAEGRESCSVELVFRLRGESYRVVRTRSRKGGGTTTLSFVRLGSDGDSSRTEGRAQNDMIVLDGKTVVETQAQIERVIGVDDRLFAMMADAHAFTSARPGERKEVLERILGLALWERYEQEAKARLKQAEADLDAVRREIGAAEERAAKADGYRDALEALAQTEQRIAEEVADAERALEEARQARASLERERDEDARRRKELDEVAEQHEAAEAAARETGERLTGLRADIEGRESVAASVRSAEEAQTRAGEMEDDRQEGERLDHEIEVAGEQQRAARAEHESRVKPLRTQMETLRGRHESDVRALETQVEALSRQTDVLGEVPCQQMVTLAEKADADPVAMTAARGCQELCADCPLLAQATQAREKLPALDVELAELKGQRPWADAERELAELEKLSPGAEQDAARNDLRTRRAGIEYDATAHTAAKRMAGQLPELQKALAAIEAAEATVAEVQARLDEQTATAQRLGERKAGLEAALGEQRDWTTGLAQADGVVDKKTSAVAAVRARQTELAQRRGALERDLAEAEAAGERAVELEAEATRFYERTVVLGLLVRAFGSNGIPAAIVGDALPEIERVANQHLDTLTGGQFWVQLRTQREKRGGKGMVETLDIVTFGPQGERLFDSFSSGEQTRVCIALRFALAALLAGQAGTDFRFAPFDEVSAPLDAEGQQAFMDSLAVLAAAYDHYIPVPTHVEAWREFVPRFEVSKDGGGSHVEMVAA